MNADLMLVKPISKNLGDSDVDSTLLSEMAEDAKRYLESFSWCERVEEQYFGLGIGGVVALFLCQIRPAKAGVDEWLWAIVGDLPSAYLVTDDTPTPESALETYVELMQEWVEAVRGGRATAELIPVNVEPTIEWAEKLAGRLDFLRREFLRGDAVR